VPNCRNCEQTITTGIKFCPHCGQKNTDGKIKVWSFLAVFFNEAFDIESKLFKTMRDIFIPGKLTIEYFKGKHKTYFHPLRFFMVLAILLVALMNFFSDDEIFSSDFSNQSLEKFRNYSKIHDKLDSLNKENYRAQQYDSITFVHINELVCNIFEDQEEFEEIIYADDNITFDFGKDGELEFEPADLIRLDSKEFADKYEIEGFGNLLLIQAFKMFKDGASGLVNFIYSKAIWVGLLMMPFLALILMLFYFKQKHYYVEHLVFCFHIHSFIFLLVTLGLLILHFLNFDLILIILLLAIPLYIVFALKKVYGQRWKTTLLKFTGIGFCYSILSATFLMLTLLLGFLLF